MSMKTMIYAAGQPAAHSPLIEPSVVLKPTVHYQLSTSSHDADAAAVPDEVRREAAFILQKLGQALVERVKEEEQVIKARMKWNREIIKGLGEAAKKKPNLRTNSVAESSTTK